MSTEFTVGTLSPRCSKQCDCNLSIFAIDDTCYAVVNMNIFCYFTDAEGLRLNHIYLKRPPIYICTAPTWISNLLCLLPLPGFMAWQRSLFPLSPKLLKPRSGPVGCQVQNLSLSSECSIITTPTKRLLERPCQKSGPSTGF